METYKRCKKCGRDLPLSAFDYTKRTEDGYMIRCRECNSKDKEKKASDEIAAFIHKDYYLVSLVRKGVGFHFGKLPQKP